MSRPTAVDVLEYLEGYGVTKDIISIPWIEKRIDNFIIPWIQKKTRLVFDAEKEYTEYLSGNGKATLMLARKPINSLVSLVYLRQADTQINLIGLVELDKEDGLIILKYNTQEGIFTNIFNKGDKNIKVVYKAGFNNFVDPNTNLIALDIKEAIICMAAKRILVHIGARTGGGSVSVEAHTRSYGNRGKYTDIINDLDVIAYEILKEYMTGVLTT